MNKIELITAKIQALAPEHQDNVLYFVEFLLSKYPEPQPQKSAEALALERLKDIDDPTQWTTVVEIGDSIDENALDAWLQRHSYKALSSSTT